MFEISKENLNLLLYVWAVVFFALLFFLLRSRRGTVGIPMAYAMGLTAIHFPGALVYSRPGYKPRHQVLIDNLFSLPTTFVGFEITTLGFIGLTVGVLCGTWLVPHTPRIPRENRPDLDRANQKMPATMLLASLAFFFVLFPIMRMIPSLGSIGAAGTGLSMAAVCLACWNAWLKGDRRLILILVAASSIGFPGMSLFFMGFTSFGVASTIVVWVFVMSFYRPRWIVYAGMLLVVFSGLTMYINYYRERGSIRDSVWGRRDSAERIDKMLNIFRRFEFLDFDNNNQLEALDVRLNQNHLVGLAANQISSGREPLANGGTLLIAATAWIPRIIWPDKPSTAGSGDIVARYTGLKFERGTSVGIGQVMEFHINFGAWFVFAGMTGMGLLLRWFDIRAAGHLMDQNYAAFCRWLMLSVGLLNVGGNTATMVASVAAAVILTHVLDRSIFAQYYEIFTRTPRNVRLPQLG